MAQETSKTGLWVDAKGNVVTKQPEGGATQLVRPGGTITSGIQARIDAYKSGDNVDEIVQVDPANEETVANVVSAPKKPR